MITLTKPDHEPKVFYDGNGVAECLADGWTIGEVKKPRKKRTPKVKHDESGTDNKSVTGVKGS